MTNLNPLYYNVQTRLFFLHKLQFRRSLLGLCASFHLIIVTGRLILDWWSLGQDFTRLKFLDALVFILSLSSRITWSFLFRDAHRFLYFRRPSNGYRCAVYVTSFATTVPNLILHILIISISSKIRRPGLIGHGQAILALFLLLPVYTGFIRMVRRFLLGENDEHYEPTVPLSSVAAQESYSDSPIPASPTLPSSSESPSPFGGHLSTAYAIQRIVWPLQTYEQERSHGRDRSDGMGRGFAAVSGAGSAPNPSDSAAAESTDNRPTRVLRCPTIAHFDYIPQYREGPNSWMTYPLVPIVLGIYSTVLFCLLSVLAYENKHSRFPSPKARCGLLAPLSGYFFCGYAIKRRLRKSMFMRTSIALPAPWILIKSLFKKPIFINSETGTSTSVDPRMRVYPTQGQQLQNTTQSAQYMRVYNAGPCKCDDYWGHLGRERTTTWRTKPTAFMLFHLGFTSYQFARGFLCIFNYPLNADKIAKLPDITIPDMQRFYRIVNLILILTATTTILMVVLVVYVAVNVICIVNLWATSVLENTPEEELRRNGCGT